MAGSRKSSKSRRKPRTPDLSAHVSRELAQHVKPRARVVAAISGGVDSMVLLDCLRRIARGLGIRLSALHVDHQLSARSRQWAAFCRARCAAWGIPFRCVRVRVRPGTGVEAGARAARYAVFARQPCDVVALAHHRDDQVETLLLQLLRGAGVEGLAGMPTIRAARAETNRAALRGAPDYFRPLLDVSRRAILAYARRRRLDWVEDESNRDTRFARNFVRHEVLPLIARRFPAYRRTVARAARHLAEASALLGELADRDMAPGPPAAQPTVDALRRLPAARARNVLRRFLRNQGVRAPRAARLDEALRQLTVARPDSRVEIELGGAALRAYRGQLVVVPAVPAADGSVRARWDGQRTLPLPGLGGILSMRPARGNGIRLESLKGKPVILRARRGGERLRPDARRPSRTLKNLFQEAGIPPWQRQRYPLLYCGDDLVWVAGIGIDSAYQAAEGEASVRPSWSGARPRAT